MPYYYFVALDEVRPNLLGRDILNLIVIGWPQFLKARLVSNVNVVLNISRQTYSDVFSQVFGEARINAN